MSEKESHVVLVIHGNRERIDLKAKNSEERKPFIAEDLATLTKVLGNYIDDGGETPRVEITLTERFSIKVGR